jgi:HD-like signal output (HDOD) protein/signal transduction histidine kinase
MDERFQNFLHSIKTFRRLPTLPQILIRLIEMCGDENVSLQEISRILSADTGLTGRVLYLANSPYYRTQQKILHINQALLQMGRNTVKNLVFSAAVHQIFSSSHGYDALHLKRFWRHSLLSAILARMIASKSGYREAEQAFFAGMVHDIGRLVLSANFPNAYAKLLNYTPYESQLLLVEEMKIGAPHTEVGAWLLRQWNLDSFIVDAVLYHHEPAERIANAFPLVKIMFTANIMAETTESIDVSLDEVIGFFSLDAKEAQDMIARAEEEMEALAQSLGIDIEPKGSLFPRKEAREGGNIDLMSKTGDMAMLFGPLQDLTEAVDEESMLQAIREGFRILFDTTEVLIFLYDKDKQALMNHDAPLTEQFILSLNQKTSILVRCLLYGTTLSSFYTGNDAVAISDEQMARRLGKKGLVCIPLITRKEKVARLNSQYRLLNLFANVVAVALHSDRLKRDCARRIQSERLAAVMAMTRRVAHEINNPLGVIKNFLLILSSKLGENHDAQKEIQIIREEINRIIRTLPELSDMEMSKIRTNVLVDFKALILDMAKMIGETMAKQRGIKIHLLLDNELPKTTTDKDGMKQIILNLLKNAIEAMNDGGNIFIEAGSSPTIVKGNGDQIAESRRIWIIIRDDGPGIDPTIREKLFEPYVTTKGKGHSGIGLSVVYQIIKDQGGDVTCESVFGKGTTFTLNLPVRP